MRLASSRLHLDVAAEKLIIKRLGSCGGDCPNFPETSPESFWIGEGQFQNRD